MAEISIEKMGKRVAEEALDGYIYKGKTLREWIDLLAGGKFKPVIQSVWVGIDDEPHEDWECGNCGFLLEAMDYPEIKQMHYCPGCGAEMVDATDS